jgi:hypothetical protein
VTSGVYLPTALPVQSAWSMADWVDKSIRSTPAGADGTATVAVTVPDTDRWQLTHALARCTSTTTTKMRLYLDSVGDDQLRDGTDVGNFNVADWAMGLWVPPGRTLVAQWTGCSTGAVATLTLQANVLRRSGG